MTPRTWSVQQAVAAPIERGRPKAAADIPEGYGVDWDDNFSFIAGFTSGGAPYGTTWEESFGEAIVADEDLFDDPFRE